MQSEAGTHKRIVLVGNPNVGKSVIFRLLTGSYVLVSNFPGTTVEISRGDVRIGDEKYEVVDTPGVNSLVPQSEDERVTCEMLLAEKPDLILQIADAKNLRRTLLITSQLAEFRIPMVLVLNMMDEAEERGVEVDARGLAARFGVPVVETVAIYSRGKKKLIQAIQNAAVPRDYIAAALGARERCCPAKPTRVTPGWLSLEWLATGDRALCRQLERSCGADTLSFLNTAIESYRKENRRSLAREIAAERSTLADAWAGEHRKKRQVRYWDNGSAARSRFWLAVLCAGLVFFLWNEAGALTGFPNPFRTVSGLIARMADAAEPRPGGFFHSVLFG